MNLCVGGAVWDRGGAGNWLWMDHRPGWVDLLDPQVKLWEGSHKQEMEQDVMPENGLGNLPGAEQRV